MIYLQPSYANPTGTVLSRERRAQVLDLAAQHGALVIEDDWARHLGIDGHTPPPLITEDPNGHVVTVTTLSKPASPGLRIGAVIARGPAGDRLRASRTGDDLCVAPMVQEIALTLLTSNVWGRHLKRLRTELAERRDALTAAIRQTLPDVRIQSTPGGGIHLWAKLPPRGRHPPDQQRRLCCRGARRRRATLLRQRTPGPLPAFLLRRSYPAQITQGVRKLAPIIS